MQRRGSRAAAASATYAVRAASPRAAAPPAAPWRRIARAFVLTYAAFAVCYLSRANAAAAKRPLAAALSLSDAALGALDALFLAAYALGNFALGVRRDVAAPPRGGLSFALLTRASACTRALLTARSRTASWPRCWP